MHRITAARRVTAWLLMLVCVWMGTGGVLNHTDAEIPTQPGTNTAGLHKQTAVLVDTCAACQWTQGLQGRTLAVCQVQFPLFPLPTRLHFAVSRLAAQSPRYSPTRAPPVSSFSC